MRAVRQAELRRRALLGAGAVAEDIYLDPEMQAASEAIKRAQMEKAKVGTDRDDSTLDMAPRTDIPRRKPRTAEMFGG